MRYNEEHNVVPMQIKKAFDTNELIHLKNERGNQQLSHKTFYEEMEGEKIFAAEAQEDYKGQNSLEEQKKALEKQMKQAAEELDFKQAAKVRDLIIKLEKELSQKNEKR